MAPTLVWLQNSPATATAVRTIDKFQWLMGFSLTSTYALVGDYFRSYLNDKDGPSSN